MSDTGSIVGRKCERCLVSGGRTWWIKIDGMEHDLGKPAYWMWLCKSCWVVFGRRVHKFLIDYKGAST